RRSRRQRGRQTWHGGAERRRSDKANSRPCPCADGRYPGDSRLTILGSEIRMTPEQIQIIKLTFAQAMISKDQVGKLFYDRLFAIAPETRPLFKGSIEGQARKLMDT